MPLQMYRQQRHINDVQTAGDSLMAQVARAITEPDGPLGEGWRRTDEGQVVISGLPWELCEAAVMSKTRQTLALKAQCKNSDSMDYTTYTLIVEGRAPVSP